jgi:hypothetical protein
MHKNRNPKTLFHTNYEKSTKLIWNKKWRNWEDRERTREIWRKEGRIKRRGLMRCWSESIQAIMIMLELNWTCLKYRWIVLFRWRFSPSAFSDLLYSECDGNGVVLKKHANDEWGVKASFDRRKVSYVTWVLMIVYGGEYDLFCVPAAWHVVWLYVITDKLFSYSNYGSNM